MKPAGSSKSGIIAMWSFFSVSVLLSGSAPANAQSITLDGSLGNGSLGNGPNYAITETVGRRIGSNLFHSFSRFGLLSGETADFRASNSIQNILARVTGREPSVINGIIRSPANFFFLNPNGVVFNSGASLDVDGLFYATTADYLRLGETAFFADESRATPNLRSVLAIDPRVMVGLPQAAGFLSERPAPITVNGSTLRVAEAEGLGLIGGDIRINGGRLVARGGQVDIVSAASSGEAGVGENFVNTASFNQLGEFSMTNGAVLDATESVFDPDGAGQITIRAGRFSLDSSRVLADTWSGSGGAIDIDVRGQVALSNGARIRTLTDDEGNAAAVRMNAQDLEISGGSRIESSTAGAGNAGSLTINASRSITLLGQGQPRVGDNGIASEVSLLASGNGGDILITTPSLFLNRSVISANSIGLAPYFLTRGQPGNIRIHTNSLEMSGAALITNVNGSFNLQSRMSSANREIHIRPLSLLSPSTIRLTGAGTNIQSNARLSTYSGANIKLQASGISLSDGAMVSASVTGGLAAGGKIDIEADQLALTSGSQIQSDALVDWFELADENFFAIPFGGAGDISIRAQESISLAGRLDGTRTRISTTTFGLGDGGRVSLVAGTAQRAGTISVDNAAIDSNNLSLFGGVSAGQVSITTDRLRVANGGKISSETGEIPSGSAGDVTIAARASVTIEGSDPDLGVSAISSSALGAGSAGTVRVSADQIVVDGGSIDSFVSGNGKGGSVRIGLDADLPIDTRDLILMRGGNIVVSSLGRGQSVAGAGSVEVNVERVSLRDGGRIAASTVDGPGGTISIRASDSVSVQGVDPEAPTSTSGAVELRSGFSGVYSDTTGAGQAGSLTIATPRLTLDDRALIRASASAQSSKSAGDINLRASDIKLNGGARIAAESFGTGSAGNIHITGISGDSQDPSQSFISQRGSVTTESSQAGGGSIAINARTLLLSNESVITTNVQRGDGSGDVGIQAQFTGIDHSRVTADGGDGSGGNISVNVSGTEKSVDPKFPSGFLILNDASEIRADGGDQGGRINIAATGFTSSPSALLQARARQPAGIAGKVGVQALIAGVSESLTPLSENFLDAARLLRARCAERINQGQTSSFIPVGRDGLPPEPGQLLSSSVQELRSQQRVVNQSLLFPTNWLWAIRQSDFCRRFENDRRNSVSGTQE